MKICFLADYRSIHTLRWAKFFAEKDEVHLISLDIGKRDQSAIDALEDAGVEVHMVSYSSRVFAPFKVRKMVRQIGPDILHAHYLTHYGFLAACSGFHPTVMTAWGDDVLIEPYRSRIKRFQVMYALKRADLLTSSGENTAKAMVKLGQKPEKIERICWGVDTKRFDPILRDEHFYDDIKNGSSGKIVINIRGFDDVYDQGTFIKAIPAVLQKYPETTFLMARESESRKYYEDLAKRLGVSSSVRFIGEIPNPRLPEYLASADVYVTASTSDSGIPVSTAEAMASGVPLISSDVADIRIWVEDGKNGLIFPIGDSNALADRILLLLSNDQMRKEIGAKGRKMIGGKQNFFTEMAKMDGIYKVLAVGRKV